MTPAQAAFPFPLTELRAEYDRCIQNWQQGKEVPLVPPEEWDRYWSSRAEALGWVLDRVTRGGR